ncbi:MAG: 50S ribosomal protein L6 [Dehalococcoidia bacterium]
MSRVGNSPIPLPQEVEVQIQPGEVTIKGPKGTLTQALLPEVQVELQDGQLVVWRLAETRRHRAMHGLTRSLLHNMVVGVVQGYQRTLELMGVGYRVQQAGEGIVLNVGYSHPVSIQPLPGVQLAVEGNNRIHVRGTDKQRVGEMAAIIRRVRPPNRYKPKGIKYAEEVLRLKPGKSAARKAL